MRITTQMIVDSAIRQMQQNHRNLFEAQEAVSSGRSFSKPSQNPIGAEREMKLISLLDRLDQFDRSVTSGASFLQESERALSQVFGLLSQAKDLALAQVTATADSVSRDIASRRSAPFYGNCCRKPTLARVIASSSGASRRVQSLSTSQELTAVTAAPFQYE